MSSCFTVMVTILRLKKIGIQKEKQGQPIAIDYRFLEGLSIATTRTPTPKSFLNTASRNLT